MIIIGKIGGKISSLPMLVFDRTSLTTSIALKKLCQKRNKAEYKIIVC